MYFYDVVNPSKKRELKTYGYVDSRPRLFSSW